MPHKHNKPRIYKTAGQVDMIIGTAPLILMIIPLKSTLVLLLFRILGSFFMRSRYRVYSPSRLSSDELILFGTVLL